MEPDLNELIQHAEQEELEERLPDGSLRVVDDQTVPSKIPFWKELLLAGRTGAGMFVESYFIFAIGNITPIWNYLYPACNNNQHPACVQEIAAVPFVEIAGIITGMIGFGWFADHLGRLWGSRCTAGLMLVAGILCVVSNGATVDGLFLMFVICIFFFSLGVGGEYPMASSTASERSEVENLARGRTIVLTFACQGWGNFVNTAIICLLLVITSTGGCSAANLAKYNNTGVCDSVGLEVVWRVQYALLIPVIAWLFWLRLCRLKESAMWLARQEKLSHLTKQELRKKRFQDAGMLYSRKYGPRLIGTAGAWFVWDVAFYGNKLFQGKIIGVIVGGAPNLQAVLNATLLNSFVALAGYYFAAFTIDKKWMGRVRMQIMGFAISAALFLACGYAYDQLVQPNLISLFQFLYYMSSFFGQWGPNATTWMLPVELFPTDIRTQAHGFSAASGKLGALVATLVFSYANNGQKLAPQYIFQISGYCCVAGLILTQLFVPDITGVPLSKIDEDWNDYMSKVRGGSSTDTENPPQAVRAEDDELKQVPIEIVVQS